MFAVQAVRESLIKDAIGKKVETESGESGLLICSNGMGIQPLDLFNDIMTTQRDLQARFQKLYLRLGRFSQSKQGFKEIGQWESENTF